SWSGFSFRCDLRATAGWIRARSSMRRWRRTPAGFDSTRGDGPGLSAVRPVARLHEQARPLPGRTYAPACGEVRRVSLPRLAGHEVCGRDVRAGVAVRDELGYATLAWRQRRSRRLPPADARDLSLRPLRPEHGAEFIESGERCLERLACRPLLLRTSAHLPQ